MHCIFQKALSFRGASPPTPPTRGLRPLDPRWGTPVPQTPWIGGLISNVYWGGGLDATECMKQFAGQKDEKFLQPPS
jgi:hypothetical protein